MAFVPVQARTLEDCFSSLHLNSFECGMRLLDNTKDGSRKAPPLSFGTLEIHHELIFALAPGNFKTSLKPLPADQC